MALDPGTGEQRRYQLEAEGNFAAKESYYPQRPTGTDRPIAHGYIMSSPPPAPPKAK